MTAAALILLTFGQAPEPQWIGQFTISTGSVVLARNGQQLAAGTRAGILPGDTLSTGADGAPSRIGARPVSRSCRYGMPH